MKLTRFLPIALLFVGVSLSAQNFAKKNLKQLKKNQWLTKVDANVSQSDFFVAYADKLGLTQHDEMKLIRSNEVLNGWSHHRYQQYHQGLPVLTAHYILHEQNGDLKKANGALLPHISVPTTANVSAEAAIQKAKRKAINDITLANDGLTPEGLTEQAIEVKNAYLAVADKAYPSHSGVYTLVHAFELEFHATPPHHDEYFVDALSGNIMAVIPKVCSGAVEGTVKTRYYGEKKVITDSVAPNRFLLQDFTRGDGIVTVNDITREAFEDEDNYWNNENDDQDEVAGDTHWGATAYFDMMLNKFNWMGLDNMGHELRSRVHISGGRSFVNAYWNGSYASFGDGNCDHFGPLVSLDVVSHEFTHGLTDFTSDLIYRNESGGLNEAMSDIFGKALEYYEAPDKFTWEIGRGFIKDTIAEPFRDMSNPNEYGDPKYYLGEYWTRFPGAVHTTSGVFNFWFYLMVEGQQGTNEKDVDYDVTGIGMDKALQIVFGTQSGYLTPSSTYADCMRGTLEVTEDLYGATSPEMADVLEAWKAVGVSYSEPYTLDRDWTIAVVELDTFICDKEVEFDITVEVKNLSRESVPAGTSLELGYFLVDGTWFREIGNFSEMFTTQSEMMPGDSARFTFRNN